MNLRAAIAGALLALAGCAATAADVCLPAPGGVAEVAAAAAPAPARERKPVGPKVEITKPTFSVVVEFRPPAEILAKQRESAYREDYDASALAFYVNASLGVLWFPNDATVSAYEVMHEICHLQEDPKKPGFLKDHDDRGKWHHTGRKDVC